MELVIMHDENALNPRKDFDGLGTMACVHSRYDLGNVCFNTRSRLEEYLEQNFNMDTSQGIVFDSQFVVVLPLYLYDHSGITMSTGSFSCPWDSGQVGFIWVTKEQVKEAFPSWKVITAARKKRLKDMLVTDVQTYDHYLTGNVYGWQLFYDGELIDSRWGYYGDDPKTNGMYDAWDAVTRKLFDDGKAQYK